MEILLEITDLSRSGPGVGREASGRVIFVPYTMPGDLARIQIVEEEKRYAEGKLLELVRPSPLRVQAPCPAFQICGGCEWQHLSYEMQWQTKKKGVLHSLERVGITNAQELPLEEFPADRIWEYRNRIQLRGFADSIGFYKKGTKEIVAVDKCWIARPEINAAISAAKESGKTRPREYKVELEVDESGELQSTWNSSHSARGFRQVHDEQNEKLRAWVDTNISDGGVLLDLYGGSGNLSKLLAKRMEEVHCVDVGAPRRGPETPSNFHFHRSEVAPWLTREAPKFRGRELTVIFDPPREGLGRELAPILDALQVCEPGKVLAIGCEPDPWARSIHRFERRGWKLEKLGVLDFFPQTHHVEALAILERKF